MKERKVVEQMKQRYLVEAMNEYIHKEKKRQTRKFFLDNKIIDQRIFHVGPALP